MTDNLFPVYFSFYTWCQDTKTYSNIQIIDATPTLFFLFISFLSQIYSFSYSNQNAWSIALTISAPNCQCTCSIESIHKERVLANQTKSLEVRKLQYQTFLHSALSLSIQVPSSSHSPIVNFGFTSPLSLKDSCCNFRLHKQK